MGVRLKQFKNPQPQHFCPPHFCTSKTLGYHYRSPEFDPSFATKFFHIFGAWQVEEPKLFSCREFSPSHVLCYKIFVRNGKTVVHAILDPWQAFHQFLRDYTVLRLCCRTKRKLQKQTCSKNGHNIFS